MFQSSRLFLAALGLLALAPVAHAELIFGITDDGNGAGVNLVSFDSGTPGSLSTVGALSGQVSGQTVRAIDFSPIDRQLYAVSASGTAGQLYTVNITTGAMTAVGTGFTMTTDPGSRLSMDFNPVSGGLRVVGGFGTNVRLNATTGALTANDPDTLYDSSVVYSNGDPIDPENDFPFIVDAAYSNNVQGATQTTLYVYDYEFDRLMTQGNINGTPTGPNSGTIFDLPDGPGSSGIVSNTGSLGFDISGRTDIGYVSAEAFPSETDSLYSVDLTTGQFTELGNFEIDMLDISVAPVPAPSSLAVLLVGLLPAGMALRRRKR